MMHLVVYIFIYVPTVYFAPQKHSIPHQNFSTAVDVYIMLILHVYMYRCDVSMYQLCIAAFSTDIDALLQLTTK